MKGKHYLRIWIETAKLHKIFFCRFKKKKREENYKQRNSQDEANIEAMRNIGRGV